MQWPSTIVRRPTVVLLKIKGGGGTMGSFRAAQQLSGPVQKIFHLLGRFIFEQSPKRSLVQI